MLANYNFGRIEILRPRANLSLLFKDESGSLLWTRSKEILQKLAEV